MMYYAASLYAPNDKFRQFFDIIDLGSYFNLFDSENDLSSELFITRIYRNSCNTASL